MNKEELLQYFCATCPYDLSQAAFESFARDRYRRRHVDQVAIGESASLDEVESFGGGYPASIEAPCMSSGRAEVNAKMLVVTDQITWPGKVGCKPR